MIAVMAPNNVMEFHEKLKRLMKRQRLSQQAVADAVGVSQNLVSLWTRNASVPDVIEGRRIADLLGVSLDYLTNPEAGDVTEKMGEALDDKQLFLLHAGELLGIDEAINILKREIRVARRRDEDGMSSENPKRGASGTN